MGRFRRAKDIKVGVIGYGAAFNMGGVHLRDMQAAGMTPTAVCELDSARREAAVKDFPGIQTYASVSDMLRKSDVNIVVVLTPHSTHAKLALQCLRAGRHVVCEKPFAVTTAECDAMIREAKRRKLLLTTYHNRHWDGCILEAVKHVRKEKVIGDVFRVEAHMGGYGQPGDWWRSSKSISGGILYDWGVHLLEYSLQIIDSDMVEVSACAKRGFWAGKTAWKADTNEDEAFAVVRFKNGAWLTLCISHLDCHPKAGMLEITGTDGSYIMDHSGYELVQKRDGCTVSTKGSSTGGLWGKYYGNVAEHLVKGKALVITPEWARRPIHILDLADRSVREGRAIKTKYK